jgi:peptide/nickel transport system ATP-binding protein/oligopeptide transport system ATP-binding protein
MSALLDVRNLSTYFYTQDGVVKAVENVSYEVARGESIALVGESGCGKTVSALSILRLIPEPPGKIVSGQVMFDGTDLLRLSRDGIREVRGARISMIFQEPMTSLNPVLTIGRQISETLELHRSMKGQQALEEAVRLLKLVGIPQAERRAKDYPHHFSGGMRQRVMMSMAISCEPQLIIADEPTTAVDVTIQAQLLEMIKEITKRLGTAIIFITHNLGIVARYAQRVYVMYAGRIVEHGPANAIYHDARHPYTVGLIASVPRLDEPRKKRLVPIDGQPPDLIALPSGCPFHPRCSHATAQCTEKRSELVEVAPGHYSTCWIAQTESQYDKRHTHRD